MTTQQNLRLVEKKKKIKPIPIVFMINNVICVVIFDYFRHSGVKLYLKKVMYFVISNGLKRVYQ